MEFFLQQEICAFPESLVSFTQDQMSPRLRPRTATEVVDAAIRENRFGEFVLYGIAIACVVSGLALLAVATIRRDPITGVLGAVCTSLFWPAAKLARQIRKETLAVRLIEAPLLRAETANEAAQMLQHFFESSMIERQEKPSQRVATAGDV